MDHGLRRVRGCALLAATCLVVAGAPAAAAPVSTGAVLSIEFAGFGTLAFSGSGTVTVSGSTVIVPAGLVTLTTKLTLPVTGSTAFSSFRLLTGAANLAGTFRPGGVASQAPGEICPGSGNHPAGVACNSGSGLGGVMDLMGSLFVPPLGGDVVQVPLLLSHLRVGAGGSTNLPFEIDAAAWSTGTAIIDGTSRHGAGSPLTLVSPTYISVDGLPFSFFSSLTLTDVHLSVPEPGALVMIGAGLAGLFVLRRRP